MLRILTGEEKIQFGDEIESSFPVKTIDDLNNIEVRLLNSEFAQALVSYNIIQLVVRDIIIQILK